MSGPVPKNLLMMTALTGNVAPQAALPAWTMSPRLIEYHYQDLPGKGIELLTKSPSGKKSINHLMKPTGAKVLHSFNPSM